MAIFARINDFGEVITVTSVNNKILKDSGGEESELRGIAFLRTLYKEQTSVWVQGSYNTQAGVHKLGGTPFRGNYAGVGFEWDDVNQIFWPQQPHPSWVKHIDSASWKSPIGDAPTLTSEQTSQNEANTHIWVYVWNEANQSWDLTDIKE